MTHACLSHGGGRGGRQEPEHLLPRAHQVLAHTMLLERMGLWSNSSGDRGLPHRSQPVTMSAYSLPALEGLP